MSEIQAYRLGKELAKKLKDPEKVFKDCEKVFLGINKDDLLTPLLDRQALFEKHIDNYKTITRFIRKQEGFRKGKNLFQVANPTT